MKHWGPKARSLMRRVATVLGLAAVLAGATASPAAADWSDPDVPAGWAYFDGLESSTSAAWVTGGSGTGNFHRVYTDNCSAAQSGCGGAYIGQDGPGFSSVGRNLYSRAPKGAVCQLSVYLERVYPKSQMDNRVNIEVINASDWTYVAAKTVRLDYFDQSRWKKKSMSFYQGNIRNWVIRFSVLGAADDYHVVNVDSVSLNCQS